MTHPRASAGAARGGLKPPTRGDVIASVLILVAVVAYAWLVLAALTPGPGASPRSTGTGPVTLLMRFGTILTGVAMLWSVWDLFWLNREEYDVGHAMRHAGNPAKLRDVLRRRGVLPWSAPTSEADEGAPVVETVIDYVVNLVDRGDAIDIDEVRDVAAVRFANVGTCARYISGLLLVLTVMGTFFGARDAMPKLGGALRPRPAATASAQAEADSSDARLAEAVDGVAGAFGANLYSLIGSVAVGLMAFGLAIGRHNLLARIEFASSLLLVDEQRHGEPSTAPVPLADRYLEQIDTKFTQLIEHAGRADASLEQMASGAADHERIRLLAQENAQVVGEQVKGIDLRIGETMVLVEGMVALYATVPDHLKGHTALAIVLREALDEARQQRIDFPKYVESAREVLNDRLGTLVGAANGLAQSADRMAEQQRQHGRLVEALLGATDTLTKTTVAEADRLVTTIGAEARTVVEAVAAAEARLQANSRAAEERWAALFMEHERRTLDAVSARLAAPLEQVDRSLAELPHRVRDGVSTLVPELTAVSQDLRGLAAALLEADVQRREQRASMDREISDAVSRRLESTLAPLDARLAALPDAVAAGVRDAVASAPPPGLPPTVVVSVDRLASAAAGIESTLGALGRQTGDAVPVLERLDRTSATLETAVRGLETSGIADALRRLVRTTARLDSAVRELEREVQRPFWYRWTAKPRPAKPDEDDGPKRQR